MFCSSWCAQAAGTIVQFRTVKGDITVELLDADKPRTVTNFLNYVQNIFPTNNMFFHRCLPGFVLQGGGYGQRDRNSTNDMLRYVTIDQYPKILNEYSVGKKVSNTYGTLAMARLDGETNSATSQYFFNLANNASLDQQYGGFTVFGKVIDGTNVLNFFNGLSKELTATECVFKGIVDFRCFVPFSTPFNDLPVQYIGSTYPRYSDLFYVDISLYNVRISVLQNGTREIRWNSVLNKTNFVEHTSGFPPSWVKLKSIKGDGLEQKAVDSDPQGAGRFYRVRVAP